MQRHERVPGRSRARLPALNVCAAVVLATVMCQGTYAQSTLDDPDEGGIGGTGHRPERVEVPERPDLPEVPDLPERIELPESPHEALDSQGGITPPDIPERPEGRP